MPQRLPRELEVQRRGTQGRLGFSCHLQCQSPDRARRGGARGEDATHIPPSHRLLLLLALPGEKPSNKSRVAASPGPCLLSKHCFLGVRGALAIQVNPFAEQWRNLKHREGKRSLLGHAVHQGQGSDEHREKDQHERTALAVIPQPNPASTHIHTSQPPQGEGTVAPFQR